jgi:hypothetical protein
LDKGQSLLQENGDSVLGEGSIKVEMGNRAIMDLCIMASKLAYENAEVVRNIVVDGNLEIFIHGYGDQGSGLLRMGVNHFKVPKR